MEIRTVEDVERELALIRKHSGDDEVAHSMEDDLHQCVLMAIANQTAVEPVAMARLALTTLEMDFERWCA